MALAVRRLSHRGVIVKRMSAVEAMGSCTVVCFDKTGTLTINRLEVARFAFEEAVVGEGGEGEFLRLAASCTDVSETEGGELVGNQLDCSLVRHYRTQYHDLGELHQKNDTCTGSLFSSEKRSMRVTLADGRVVVKGAIDQFESSDLYYGQYQTVAKEWSETGLRVIGVGTSTSSGSVQLCGIVAFRDQLRPDAKQTINQLALYRVDPVMLTGDGEGTAKSVAVALNWPTTTGTSTVLSRQTPKDKLRFVASAQSTPGAVVAMVGDGVNDGAAVRRANVGIAMGGPQSTDVARQAADIVLSNDRLSGIVECVWEGRIILYNVKRFLGFQLSSSLASLLLVVVSDVVAGMALSPLHLLFLNIVMDGPPAQSLAMSHVDHSDLVKRPEHGGGSGLLTGAMIKGCVGRAVMVVAGCLVYVKTGPTGGRSILPPLLALSLANAYSWSLPDYHNRYLFGCVLVTAGCVAVAAVVPAVGLVVGVGRLGVGEVAVLAVECILFMLPFAWAGLLGLLRGRRGYQKIRYY
jgi:Ca2+-transporting ATPase